nr:hypothetical protein [Tanacetum cinerariifolium]
LNCFHLASGLCINVNKSHVLGVGVPLDIVRQGALRIGCEVMQTPFKYLRVMVGDHMSRYSAWSNTIQKVHGRLTRIAKLHGLHGRRCYCLRKIGVLEYLVFLPSTGLFFSNEYDDPSFKMVLCGDGLNTRFLFDTWILDLPLNIRFPRLFALELDKDISVATKWSAPSFDASFRRQVRDGVERNQWSALLHMLGTNRSRLSLIGLLGSVLFVCRLSLKPCWRVFSTLLGGMSGPFEIVLALVLGRIG